MSNLCIRVIRMKNKLMIKFLAPFIIFLFALFIVIYIVYRPLYKTRFLNEKYLSSLEAKTKAEGYVEELKNTVYVAEAYLQSSPNLIEFGRFITNVQKLNEGYLNVYFGDTVPYPNGGIFINTLEVYPLTYDQTSRDWYKDSVATNDVMISEPYIDFAVNKLTITFAKAVYTNGLLKGVFSIDFANINSISDGLKKNFKDDVYIVSDNGVFMTHDNAYYILNETNNLFTYPIFSGFKDNLISHIGDLDIIKDEWYSIQKTDNAPWLLVFKGSAEPFYSQFRFLMISLFLCIVILIVLECLLVARIVIPLSNNLFHAITIMTLMQDGRFDSQFDEKDLNRKDVFGMLANSINDMQHIMYNIVSELKANIAVINNSSQKISKGINNLSDRTSSQAAAVEQITSSIENLFSAISNTSKNSYNAKNMSSKVTESTQNGVAVVASEIRALAQNVNEAAGNITSIIENTVAKIEIGDESVKRSLDILLEIENSAKDVANILVDIYESASSEEESVKQINTAMNELNNITQENAELVNDSSVLGKEVVDGTSNLYSELEYFKLDKNFK